MRIFLLLATAGFLTFASPVLAQQTAGKTPQDRATQRTEKMTRDLGLSAEQAAKVKEINNSFANELDGLRPTETEKSARRERREKAQQLRSDYDSQLKAVLTPDQYARHQALQNERRERHQDRRHNGRGAGFKRNKTLPDARPEQSTK